MKMAQSEFKFVRDDTRAWMKKLEKKKIGEKMGLREHYYQISKVSGWPGAKIFNQLPKRKS